MYIYDIMEISSIVIAGLSFALGELTGISIFFLLESIYVNQ